MGRVDLFHSRRTNYYRCKYWQRDNNAPANTFNLSQLPSGIFYAKPLTAEHIKANNLVGGWLHNNEQIMIETDDDVDTISRGCVVEFNNELWLVSFLQKKLHTKESEFSKKPHYKYILALIKSKGF